MFVQNTSINFQWELGYSASFASYVETYFDLQITAPDGTVTYLEGSSNWADTFTQPTVDTDGLIEYAYTPTQDGVYVMILGTGTSENFTILHTRYISVVTQDAAQSRRVRLP